MLVLWFGLFFGSLAMPDIDWTPGTIVYLKSGSPPLTVTGHRYEIVLGVSLVDVEWFNGAEVKRDTFPNICLQTDRPHYA